MSSEIEDGSFHEGGRTTEWRFVLLVVTCALLGSSLAACDSAEPFESAIRHGGGTTAPNDSTSVDPDHAARPEAKIGFAAHFPGSTVIRRAGVAYLSDKLRIKYLTPDTEVWSVPVFSPDGSTILVAKGGRDGEAYLIDIVSGEARPMMQRSARDPQSMVPVLMDAEYAHWGPRGDWVVYTQTDGIAGGSRSVHRYDFDTQTEAITGPPGYLPLGVISPDTLLVWGRVAAGGPFGMLIMATDFSWVSPLGNSVIDSRMPSEIAFDARSRRLAYVYIADRHFRMAITDLAGTYEHKLDLTPRDVSRPLWRAEGVLVYEEYDERSTQVPRGIWEVDIRTSSFRPLLATFDVEGASHIHLGSFHTR